MSSPGSERGQAAVEYAGVLVLVGLLLAALFAVVPRFGEAIAHTATCLVPGGDCGAAGTTASDHGAADAPRSIEDVSRPAAPSPTPAAGAANASSSATPTADPTPAPAPTPAAAGWTGQAANLPRHGRHPYVPPKKSHGKPQRARGDRGTGFEDEHGNIWVWDPRGHAGPHWDVQHPGRDRKHTNVYPDGEVHQGEDNFPNRSDGDDGASADESTARSIGILGGLAAGGGLLWWLGKAASPACGPAVVACAIVF